MHESIGCDKTNSYSEMDVGKTIQIEQNVYRSGDLARPKEVLENPQKDR